MNDDLIKNGQLWANVSCSNEAITRIFGYFSDEVYTEVLNIEASNLHARWIKVWFVRKS